MLLSGLILLASLLGSTLGCGSDPPPPNKPPVITCPTLAKNDFVAEKTKTAAKVTWALPNATDTEDDKVKPTLKSGQGPGSLFEKGTHSVFYEVRDSKGLKDFCSFTFTVSVIQCRPVNYLRHGQITNSRYYYGDTLSFKCDEGYNLDGNSVLECLRTGEWNHENPSCVAKECKELTLPPNALRYTCTNGRKAGSTCWLTCKEDNGYGPVAGQITMCGNNEKWTGLRMECVDIERPTIVNCPTGILSKSKDPTSNITVVVWDKPISVTDNSGKPVALKPDRVQADGTRGTFQIGATLVKFTATDAAGNEANYCTFLVKIQTLTCDPPKMADTNLETPGCVDFAEGKSCSLSCYLALKIEGPKVITCKKSNSTARSGKGVWSWGQDVDPSIKAPSCKVHSCPKLASPRNGAMACDLYSAGESCQMSCMENHDVPSNKVFTSLYLCPISKGVWSHPTVPDCEYEVPGSTLERNGYYYFKGSCNSAKESIKAKFLEVVKQNNACPAAQYCILKNVEVRCGDVGSSDSWDRKKREAGPSWIEFTVAVNMSDSRDFESELRAKSSTVTSFTRNIMVGTYYRGTEVLVPGNRIASKPALLCKPGLKLGALNKRACVPCPPGSYHNVTKDQCYTCPLGQYQGEKGQTSCLKCQEGYTTITVGNNETTACEKMCQPGHFSPKGVVPCAECPEGTYSATPNTQECTHCPVGMTTISTGADSLSKCLPFDTMLQGPVTAPLEGKTPIQICDFTFTVWVKSPERAASGVRFELANPVDGTSLNISASTSIDVTLFGNKAVHVPNALDTKWHHVAVIWSEKTLRIYKDKVLAKSQLIDVTNRCPSSRESDMQITIRNFAYVYLRDLNFLPKAVPNFVSSMSACSSNFQGSLFTLDQLDIAETTCITDILPSTCLKPDPCDPNPCGNNVCIPGLTSVTCACKRGYTGPKCETPPDYCKDNICKNNATCYVNNGFACSCLPGYVGTLCERRIADGGWSDWYDFSRCSSTCGQGVQTRNRFCTNPKPDPGGKPCPGSDRDTRLCNEGECPVCDQNSLVLGKGVIKECTTSEGRISCTIKCELGKVLPERPFPYVCAKGFWTPTRQTVSCTDPVTPLTAGIKYEVIFGSDLTSKAEVGTALDTVGNAFACAKSHHCQVSVSSSDCSPSIPMCTKHSGAYYGSLIIQRGILQNPINVMEIQENEHIKPLFQTWNVFSHSSDEAVTPLYRPLEMVLSGDVLKVYPHGHSDQFVIVPDQFGNIMKAWKSLDNTNWEVRTSNYSSFHASGNRNPTYLHAMQMMTCPSGSIQGGVFCMKCPPGKYFHDQSKECKWCTNGFYQDHAGEHSCKACPGFQTTHDFGSSDVAQCKVPDIRDRHILLGMTSPKIGVLPMADLDYREMSMTPMFSGNVDYLAFHSKEQTIFFSTQSPSAIGRVSLNGENKIQVMSFKAGTVVTGMDVDVGSNLLFYMTNKGQLVAYHIISLAIRTLLPDLQHANGLVLDQNMGIYWMETATIKYMHYGDHSPRSLYTDSHAIWGLTVANHGRKLMWQSHYRLRSSNLDGSDVQTLSVDYTDSFGATDDYYFTVKKEGSALNLMRENRDRTAIVKIHTLPQTASRMKIVSTKVAKPVDQPCLESRTDCSQGCLPFNSTYRECFCKKDFTLQKDHTSCRRDFSINFEATDSRVWYKPTAAQYSIPPSKTLRFNLRACKSAKLALTQAGRELYLLRIDHHMDNKTYIDLKKQHLNGVKVNLVEKQISLLSCNEYRRFWVTWRMDTIRGIQSLKVGSGDIVGLQTHLYVSDAHAFTVNFIQFGVGFNSTAYWQI